MEKRVGALQTKVAECEGEIAKLRTQLKTARGSSQTMYKQRAMQLLKKRNMYMSQLQTIQGTQFNVEQMKFASESVQDTINTVSAMKEAAKVQKQQMKQIKIGEIDTMMDDIADLQLDAEEINDIMSRDYSANMVDEDELDAELAEMDNEGLLDELDSGALNVPSGMPVQPKQEEGKIGMPS